MGALGPGAPDQAKSIELITKYQAILNQRLTDRTPDQPKASKGQCDEISQILFGATLVSAPNLEQKAKNKYSAAGCS
ncbi:MAG: hypothetical protein DWQ07_19270 [Chloroflexi bacterium]|nr:MAG: hypothetical protein DWQ07_19270 [Chloroflexota bacterium]MBL1195074.1 hypothetical protein [Chloroflexota bacterium]